MQFFRYPLDPLAYFDMYIYGLWNMPNNHDDDDEDEDQDQDQDEDEDDDDDVDDDDEGYDLPIKNGDIPLQTFKLPKGNVPFAGLRGFTITFWSFGGEIVLVSHPLTHSC